VSGTVYAIGLGPGDPELLTIKGQRLLREVDVIFVPAQDQKESLARRILTPTGEAGKIRELAFRMSKKPEENRARWQQHADTIAAAVAQGQSAAFATEGDPMLYSTFLHIYAQLLAYHPEVPVEIVPGVSSITAGAAVAHLPLADERRRVAIVPATGEVMHAVATFDTIVILKVSAALDTVLKALDNTGRLMDAVYVERAGWPNQRIVKDVETLRKQKLDYFGQIIVTR
jgi:precorrin-2/cobalt-factor-2 C20-methyltransferase